MDQRFIFGIIVITLCSISQWIAWYLQQNGQIFAFTSLIIGLTAGSLLGFSFKQKGKD